MTPTQNDPLLNASLEDYHRRKGLGEQVEVEIYKDRLGDRYGEFVELLITESAIDDELSPKAKEVLPRPFGPYTLLKELGRGAVGVVYEALHRNLGRRVALKVLRTGFDTNETARERFRREARACAQVHHKHIVDIHEAGEQDERPYYAMRLLDGEPLSKLIKEKRVPDPATLCRELAGVASALSALHDVGIVHRDVKPSNIIVEPSGRMVLADFGLARAADALGMTRTGDALGTPLYMSPEQMLGKRNEIDGRTDVYGLGATLYEALTGQPPFKTEEMQNLIRMVLSDRPQPVRKLNSHVPRDCELIVMKCLEKRRRDRYASAAALEKDLVAFAEGESVSGRPVSSLRYALRRMARRPVATGGGLLAAASLVAALFIAKPWEERSAPSTVARLALQTIPSAALVSLNDGVPEPAPLQKELAPGSHTVRLSAPLFEDRVEQLAVEAGQNYQVLLPLTPKDPENKDALEQMREHVQLARLSQPRASSSHRGMNDDGPEIGLIFPRGKVRIQDLEDLDGQGAMRVDVNEDFAGDGEISLRVGDRVESLRFVEPDYPSTWLSFPATLRESLRPGDTVTWSYTGDKFRAQATFTIVADDASDALRVLDEDWAKTPEAQRPKMAVAHAILRAEVLLSKGLYVAAYRSAMQASKAGVRSLRLLALQRDAVVGMFADEPELCNDSKPYIDLTSDIDGSSWTAEQRARVFGK